MSDSVIEKAEKDLISALAARKALKNEVSEAKRRYELATHNYKAARSMFVQAFVAAHGGIHKLISDDIFSVKASTTTITTNLAERLKIARESTGKSQKEIANLVHVSYRAWQGYEIGENVPGGKIFESLVQMGFDANWLFTGEGNMTRRTMEGL